MLYQPCSALGERQLEQGHGGVHHAGLRCSSTQQGRRMWPSCTLPAALLLLCPAPSAVRLCAWAPARRAVHAARGGPCTAASIHRSHRAPVTALPERDCCAQPRGQGCPAGTGSARPCVCHFPSSGPPISLHAWESHHNACNNTSKGQVLGTERCLFGVEQSKTNTARCFGTFQSLAVSQEEEQKLWHLRWTFSGRQDVCAWASSGARLYPAHLLPGPSPAHLSRFRCHGGCAAGRASRRASGCRAQSRG